MTLFAHRRSGAPFALIKDQSLPATIDINMGGVATEVASLSAFGSVTTGAEAVPVTAPANAQQVFRYRFIPSETTTIVDQSPNALNANVVQYFGTDIYGADGQVTGAYGFNFFGINISSDRAHIEIPNNARFGAARTRFIIGVRPYEVGDYTQTYLTLLRAQTGDPSNPNYIWSLVRGLDNSLVFGPGFPEGSTALVIKNVFTDNVHCTIELEIDGQDIRIWKDNVLISDDYIFPAPVDWSTSLIRVGNQTTSGAGPLWGHMSHLAAYTGDLTDGEVRWIRDTAKTMIETSPKILTVPTPPTARPAGQLTITRSPSFSSKIYALEDTTVDFSLALASDGIGGPIASSYTLTLGGSDVKPARGHTLVPSTAGDLVLTSTFDNAIHPAQSASVTLPILVAYPALDEATIKTRLGGVGDPYIDAFDAGFPYDAVWKREMVVDPGDGTVGFRILPNNKAGRTNLGGSVQLNFVDQTGDDTPGVAARLYAVDGYFQLIDTRANGLAKGYVQTLFTFTVPYNDPRREIDYEYNSQTGMMECTIHLAPNDAPTTSTTVTILFAAPETAFTGQRKWSIISNADRIEWAYEDTIITRYIRGVGFDNTVQNFTLYSRSSVNGAITLFGPSSTFIHPNDAGWHLNPQNVIIQQWMGSTLTGWIGPNTVPLDHPLFKYSALDAQEWGPVNTALQVGDWTATPIGGGQVRVNVSNYRPSRFRPTHLAYSVDGGAWTRLAGAFGNQTISGVATGSRQIRLRPVAESLATNPAVTVSNYTMNANASDTKTVTVT
jgi:archaellum component FlaG (FlaF/FlaG flagellin family)